MTTTEMPKKKETMVRTSVQLPQDLVDELEHRWPSLSQSEALRMMLERYRYLTDVPRHSLERIINAHFDLLDGALEDFDYKDWKVIARSLSSIVNDYVDDETVKRDVALSNTLNEIENFSPTDRVALLDEVVTIRMRRELKDAGWIPEPPKE